MPNRRNFLKLSATATAAAAFAFARGHAATFETGKRSGPGDDRAYWCDVAKRLANPALDALSRRRLKIEMPLEAHPSAKDRREVSHLEAVGRLLVGLAPWLELEAGASPESEERTRLAGLAREGVDAITDPASPDFLNFKKGGQPLVDAAFLAQAMLRAPRELWQKLDPRVQKNVVAALISSRPIPAGESNWKLFATIIEVFLHTIGEKRDDRRLFEGIDKHRAWYLGDGVYGDGPEFHWDYYNSFVIQPMLVEALDVVGEENEALRLLRDQSRLRLTRWAEIQERMIAPDGAFPVIGRSIAYRCGAFQGLALAAWRKALPEAVVPPQARAALTAVIRRTLEAPGTWDDRGWLRIGLAGHQPNLGEGYISTGSLYLCSVALLPLGLPADDVFWTAEPAPTTWEKVWRGENLPIDVVLEKRKS